MWVNILISESWSVEYFLQISIFFLFYFLNTLENFVSINPQEIAF